MEKHPHDPSRTLPSYPPLSADFLTRLARLLPASRLLTGLAQREAYAWDNTGIRALPGGVALVENHRQTADVLRLCHEHRVPVVPRGAGTGNVGGALAEGGGLVLSTQRMDRVVEIAPEDRLAVVEPGVVNGELQTALEPYGLFWPPDPSSARSCTIGGNLAMCAAGPGAVRYGVTRDWVLGLTAVLPDGTTLRTGGRTTKGVVGYDLTRLLIGSEGTLAVITQATLKLAARPAARRVMRVLFATVAQATQAVSSLMATGSPPTAIEFLDGACLDLLRQSKTLTLPEAGRALLLLEFSGEEEEVIRQGESMARRLAAFSPLERSSAVGEDAASEVWSARSALSPILKKLAPKRINEDVVVPVSRLPQLIHGIEEIASDLDVPIVNFGHAGNGNIHVNLLVDPGDPRLMNTIKPALDRLFRLVLALDGSLSGEHGVGTQKRAYLPWEIDAVSLQLQRRIRAAFDPHAIMNPGKIFLATAPPSLDKP